MKNDNMSGNSVPAFLTKLWALVENPQWQELICWDSSGKSFHLFNQAKLAKEVLPLYFKHGNISSFIRQLNMYGFRKVMNIEQGGMKNEKEDVEFAHPYFVRGQEHLLELIRRKTTQVATPQTKVGHGGTFLSQTSSSERKQHMPPLSVVKSEPIQMVMPQSDAVEKILEDVHEMKGKQDKMSTKLEAMKRENEVLWREVASLRQKHMKQQQIVNKLIQFLVHIVRSNRVVPGTKRKLPLMISDVSHNDAKSPKYDIPLADTYTVQSPISQSDIPQTSGPVIHEITDLVTDSPQPASFPIEPSGGQSPQDLGQVSLDSSSASQISIPPDLLAQAGDLANYSLKPEELHMFNTEILPAASAEAATPLSISDLVDLCPSNNVSSTLQTSQQTSSPQLSTSIPVTQRPVNASSRSTPQNDNSMALAVTPSSTSSEKEENKSKRQISRQRSIHEVTDHVSTLDSDLDGLKELLSGNNFTFDQSTLLNLFSPESSINIPGSENLLSGIDFDQDEEEGNKITGNELVQFKSGSEIPDLFDLQAMTENQDDTSPPDLYKNTPLDTPVPAQVSAEDLD